LITGAITEPLAIALVQALHQIPRQNTGLLAFRCRSFTPRIVTRPGGANFQGTVERSEIEPGPEGRRPNYTELRTSDLTFLNPDFSITLSATTSSNLAPLNPNLAVPIPTPCITRRSQTS